ncbi:ImmA/IrrE family metallo-endopeptidase [Microbacterium sp. AGC85]
MSELAGLTVGQIRQKARADAANTAELYLKDAVIPVDPIAIARDMGAQVFSAQLGDDVYGMVKGTTNGIEIFVDVDNPRVRQRFTVAHEVGHVVANRGVLEAGVGYVEKRSEEGSGRADEIYANEFAASILMPENDLREAHGKNPNIFQLASLFDVSTSAMGWRLRHLNLAY